MHKIRDFVHRNPVLCNAYCLAVFVFRSHVVEVVLQFLRGAALVVGQVLDDVALL